jgi:hypothetical protein
MATVELESPCGGRSTDQDVSGLIRQHGLHRPAAALGTVHALIRRTADFAAIDLLVATLFEEHAVDVKSVSRGSSGPVR